MATTRTVLLTGATSGIGAAAAQLLVRTPGRLILHGPQPESEVAEQLQQLRDVDGAAAEVHYLSADFRRPGAVGALAERVDELGGRLDVLINNAAVPGALDLVVGDWHVEETFGVNYLAPTLLTDLLLPAVESARGRVVNVSSATHLGATLHLDDLSFESRAYAPVSAYAQSKLAIVVHTTRLSSRTAATVVSVHPGVLATALLHAMFRVRGADARDGGSALVAATTVPVVSGSYLDETAPGVPNVITSRRATQEALHEVTSDLLGRRIR